jgi:hypothetical protein
MELSRANVVCVIVTFFENASDDGWLDISTPQAADYRLPLNTQGSLSDSVGRGIRKRGDNSLKA